MPVSKDFERELSRTRAERGAWRRHDRSKFAEDVGVSEHLAEILAERDEDTFDLDFHTP
jgi:hypothetical protein